MALAEPHGCRPQLFEQLSGFAARLMDIAGCVATEAESATIVVRSMVDQAARVASLAEALVAAANDIEKDARRQSATLASARVALDINKPAIDALARSVDAVASISASISQIAQESGILSLNARIEAARAGTAGSAFGVVAAEMSALTTRTKLATDDIGERAGIIAQDVSAASGIVAAHAALVVEQDDLLTASLAGANRQHQTAAELAAITAETAETVDAAASAIGRVGANAVAVKVLARQIARLAAE